MIGMAPSRAGGIAVGRACVMKAGSAFVEFEASMKAMNGVVTVQAAKIERHGCKGQRPTIQFLGLIRNQAVINQYLAKSF